jgi:sugar (pentulose or hexulose) kinase
MGFIAIDLGTTNIKVAVFDDQLQLLSMQTENVNYFRNGDFVEFDPEDYYKNIEKAIANGCQKSFQSKPFPIRQIVLTGQAESLITVDENLKPIRNGISWLDMRSKVECEQLKMEFDPELCYRTTGQPAIIPTWPITKILWLRKNEPELYAKIGKYLLLKDFILYKMTGDLAGEYSIYNFSHYFNITGKKYWEDILSFCGVSTSQLPELIEPCTQLEKIRPDIARNLGLNPDTKINVGTLDHFAGMIGTGNITEGILSESTGTVLSIATMVPKPVFSEARIPCHYGPFKDSYVLLPVCESGGISLEWFKKNFMPDASYEKINQEISKRTIPNELVFLPYITGVNAPDFNNTAKGVFYGINLKHDAYDFALAVMEGISHLLKINIDHIEATGYKVDKIISTGGGARSDLWSQLKADITDHQVLIPSNEEAACLGAAIIGAVSEGTIKNYQEAIQLSVSMKKQFLPSNSAALKHKHDLFKNLYEHLDPVFKFDSKQ